LARPKEKRGEQSPQPGQNNPVCLPPGDGCANVQKTVEIVKLMLVFAKKKDEDLFDASRLLQ
jgi:hypothetical protein